MGGDLDISWAWGIGLIGFAFGIACGTGIGLLIRGRRQRERELESELAELQQAFDSYREQVSQHFLTTSELVQKMTDSYREVYEHLASGSQALCQSPVNTPSLDFTRQPVLDTAAEQQPEDVPEPATAGKVSAEDNENDTCIGDAPHVPTLDAEEVDSSATRH